MVQQPRQVVVRVQVVHAELLGEGMVSCSAFCQRHRVASSAALFVSPASWLSSPSRHALLALWLTCQTLFMTTHFHLPRTLRSSDKPLLSASRMTFTSARALALLLQSGTVARLSLPAHFDACYKDQTIRH